VLPSSKRYRQPSSTELVYTGEIEVLSERAPLSTRGRIDRLPSSYPPPRSMMPTPSDEGPDSSTRIAISIPRRHETMVPPSSRSLPQLLADSGDDMTVLLAHKPRLAGFVAQTRRPTPWSVQSTPVPTPTPFPRARPPFERDPRRLAVTGPALRRSEEAPPDSLRPVAMQAAGGGDISGRHEVLPTSFTMRTQAAVGRPTLSWAAALVVIGGLVGLGSALFAQGGGGPVASSTTPVVAPETAAAAGQPQAEGRAEPVAPAQPATAPTVAAPTPTVAAPVAPANPAPSDARADVAATPGPLAALIDTKKHGDSSSQRPTYVAPGSAAPGRRWVAASKALPPAPSSAALESIVAKLATTTPAPAAAPAPVVDTPPAPQPAPKAATKSRAKRGADADLQAASASDALARAQLEAALR